MIQMTQLHLMSRFQIVMSPVLKVIFKLWIEIRDFAIHLGMKLPEDNRYLDLAREGLKAKLPDEWKV